MSPLKPQSRYAVLAGIAAVLVIGFALLLLWRQTETIPEIAPTPAKSVAAEGFTLFDVGYQTPLTQSLLNHLNSQLGSHAVERRVPIDLTLNYPGFLKENFKELNALNQKLNPSGKARVEHNALKFSYRYARKKNIPFDYIEMIFSGYSHTPAILRVRTRQTGLNLADTLTRKYGPAQTLEWTSKSGRTLWWQEKSGMLFLSEATDRSGILIYEISIYYVDTIEKLLLAEEEELRQKTDRTAPKRRNCIIAWFSRLADLIPKIKLPLPAPRSDPQSKGASALDLSPTAIMLDATNSLPLLFERSNCL